MKKEKGSMLVLTMISVLVLSIMVLGLLTVGTTEIQTTQNYHLNKAAYYTAVEGVEDLRLEIMKNPGDSAYIGSLTKSATQTFKNESFKTDISGRQFGNVGITRSYVTGNIKDFNDNTFHSPTQINLGPKGALGQGYTPQLRGMNLSDPNRPEPVIWRVQITAEAGMGSRKGYSEIIAGIYAPLSTTE